MGVMAPARFAVGDRAEYWSETYQQWMPGIVKRVRDWGAVYDLDIKKGAQASKLRLMRNATPAQDMDNLFRAVDSHGGITSRSKCEGAFQSQVIESSGALAVHSARVPPLPLPPMTARTKATSQPASARGSTTVRRELIESAVQRHRPGSREREATLAHLQKRAENGVATPTSQETKTSSPRPTAIQARQPQTDIVQFTRPIREQPQGWAEAASQDMASRAGAVTVRRMVETTKVLLQGLEGALILRAGFIAGCFHMWRCEATLFHAWRLYEEELERHHDEWAAHLDHHKKSFEAELRAHAERADGHRRRVHQQQALLLDTWAHGEGRGLMRQAQRAWRTHAHREKGLKRVAANIHRAVFTWAEGKRKGSVHSTFAAWHHLQGAQSEVRRKEAEMEKLHKSYQSKLEDQQRMHDKIMRDQLLVIEAHNDRSHRSIEVVVANWKRGSQQGMLIIAMRAWMQISRKSSAAARRTSAVEVGLRRCAEGKARGDLRCLCLHWKSLAAQSRLWRRHEAALEDERRQLQGMLVDSGAKHQSLLQQRTAEAERLHRRTKNAVDAAVAKWESGDRRELARSTLGAWATYAGQAKRLARKRQAVHTAMLRCLEGSRRGVAHCALLNWAALHGSQKHARLMEERVEREAQQWRRFLEEMERTNRSKLGEAENAAARAKARAHAASEMMLRKWLGGERKGLMATAFADWKRSKEITLQKDRKRNAVKDVVFRFTTGENCGIMRSAFQGWKNYVHWEVTHSRLYKEKDEQIALLEQRVQKMLSHGAARLQRYCEVLAAHRRGAFRGLCFAAWRDESQGIRGRLEAKRREEVKVQEMQRAHQMAETRHKAERLKALQAMGFKRSGVALLEAFLLWVSLVEKRRETMAVQCSHNEVMQRYSSFIIVQKLKKDASTLLASSFAEWRWESKILYHQRHHDHAQRNMDESRACVIQLEAQRAELQDQLCVYYQQIDLVTETLQKELKTKEELANELRRAYGKMRKPNLTPTTASNRVANDVGSLSQTSSEQTADGVSNAALATPRSRSQGPNAAGLQLQGSTPWRLPVTGVELPPSPSLSLRRGGLLRGSGVSRGTTGLHSQDRSPSHCGWDCAVERMSEEGIVRLGKRAS